MQDVISVACVQSEWLQHPATICFSLQCGDCHFNPKLDALFADLGHVTEMASFF
jgi:hypothetical protein